MSITHRQPNSPVSVGVLALTLGLLFTACGEGQSSTSTAPAPRASSTTVEPTSAPGASSSASVVSLVPDPDPAAIVGVYEAIQFYPACVNERLDHQGVTWYPIVAAGVRPIDPALQPRVDEIFAIDRENSPVTGVRGIVRVVAPGPGDDIGTLVVWEDGVARWVSDSRDLDVWMIDDEIEYMWAC